VTLPPTFHQPSTNLPPTFHHLPPPSTDLCVPPPYTPVVVEHPSTRWNGWGALPPVGGSVQARLPLIFPRGQLMSDVITRFYIVRYRGRVRTTCKQITS
jgi:hypothetical protein